MSEESEAKVTPPAPAPESSRSSACEMKVRRKKWRGQDHYECRRCGIEDIRPEVVKQKAKCKNPAL